jgi:Tol biopolymer transport system component
VSASSQARALSASFLLVLIACSSGTEPPARVVVADIDVNASDEAQTITVGATVVVNWTSENATSCLVTPGGWTGTTGSEIVEHLTATTTYRLSCSGSEGEAEDTVQVVVTPIGTEIVFQTKDSTRADIYVVNADGSGLARLTDYPGAAPSWSGDGRQIYFLSTNRDGNTGSGLYVMNPDGTDVRLVADSISGPYAVSPDGTRVVFGALQVGASGYPNLDLFVLNVAGSERTLILDLPCPFLDAGCQQLNALAWSPDGQRIAYSARIPGHGGSVSGIIGIVNADGTGQRYLNTSGGRSSDPAWSPDGQRIVYSSGESSTIPFPSGMDLEIINADGTGRMVVLESGADITSPSWSPDMQSIVFARFSPAGWVPAGPSEMFVVNVDGSGLRRVADTPGEELAPDWNPAGP